MRLSFDCQISFTLIVYRRCANLDWRSRLNLDMQHHPHILVLDEMTVIGVMTRVTFGEMHEQFEQLIRLDANRIVPRDAIKIERSLTCHVFKDVRVAEFPSSEDDEIHEMQMEGMHIGEA